MPGQANPALTQASRKASAGTWEDAMRKAGWTASRIPTGLGIVKAESGGKRDARNTNTDADRTTDRGGWQFNDKWHPEVSDRCADDPVCSSRAAWRVSKRGTDFSQWSTNGAAPINTLTITGGDSGGLLGDIGDAVDSVVPDIPNPLDGIKQIAALISTLFEADTWFRIIKTVGGSVLILVSGVALISIAVKTFSQPSSAPRGGPALKKAAKRVPVVKAVKAVT